MFCESNCVLTRFSNVVDSEILDEGEEDNEENNRKPAAIPNPDADGDNSEEEEDDEDEEEEPEFNESSLEGDY